MKLKLLIWIIGLFILISSVNAVCNETWIGDLTPPTCLNGTQLITYTDLNMCNTTTFLPADNGTNINCSISNTCAFDICLDPIRPNVTCCMVSPTLFCNNYFYTMFDDNGTIISNNSLTVFNQADTSYYFNFNRPVGQYYIRLCDDSTRQVKVVDNMISQTDWTIIILMIVTFASLILGLLIYTIAFWVGAFAMFGLTITLYLAGYNPILWVGTTLLGLVFIALGIKFKK